MRILQSGRLRIQLRQVMWITVAWTMLGAFDALNIHAMTGSEVIKGTEAYDFQTFFWTHTLSGLVAGLVSGSLLIFILREAFRRKSFGFSLLINSLIISGINFFLSALAYDLFLSLQIGRGPLTPEVLEETSTLIRSTIYLKNLLFWSVVTVLTIIFLHVNDKYGRGVLFKLLLGLYHDPREEERIFMFVDIRSSTTIAEQLGHIRFFNLLNDFFRDITNPVINTEGEIYQYVGDEVVISWPIERGLHNANCVRCFYGMQEAVRKRAARYQERYGLVPEFKAGLHCGRVTTGEIGVIKKDIVFSGDVLNTTSRIQSVCNNHGVKILLSKPLLDRLNLPPHHFSPRRVGIINLKGKSQRMELYSFEDSAVEERVSPSVPSGLGGGG